MYINDVTMAVVLSLAAALPLYLVFYFLTRKRYPVNIFVHLVRYLFVAYLICLFWTAWQPMLPAAQNGYSNPGIAPNLKPFSTIFPAFAYGNGVMIEQILLNAVVFMPLGMALPVIFPRKMNQLWKVALAVFCCTLLIETVQLFNPDWGRIFDVDDLICNFAGGITGYALMALLDWIFGKRNAWRAFFREPLSRASRIGAFVLALIFPLAALAGMVVEQNLEFGHPAIAGYRASLPGDLQLTCQMSVPPNAMVYEYADADEQVLMQKLQKAFGLSGEAEYQNDRSIYALRDGKQTITIFCGRGDWWTYSVELPEEEYQNPAKDEDCRAAAKRYLKERGLWNENFEQGVVGDWEMENSEGGSVLMAKTVSFAFPEEYRLAQGSVTVAMNARGVLEVSSDCRYYQPYREEAIFTPEECLTDVQNRPITQFYVENEVTPERIEFDRVRIIYEEDADKGQRLPVWEFTGQAYGREGSAPASLRVFALKGF